MCGRYATTRSNTDLSLLFGAESLGAAPEADGEEAGTPGPSWNVAPTDPVPVVRVSRSQEARVLDVARWGFLPPWAKEAREGARMINARSETVATSKAFAAAFAKRRCLVQADGWFEWVRDGKRKQAFYMTPADGAPLAFAGIWSVWGPRSLLTCSVLTAASTGNLSRVHDRMPLILPADRWPDWLAGGGEAMDLLRPMSVAELDRLEIRPVGAGVGNVRNNGPDLLAQVTPDLFPKEAAADLPKEAAADVGLW